MPSIDERGMHEAVSDVGLDLDVLLSGAEEYDARHQGTDPLVGSSMAPGKILILIMMWRREWDSNPRYAFTYTRVPGVRLKPLGHLS